MKKTFKDRALFLAGLGVPVIPVQPGLKACKLPHWQKQATTDTAMIEYWDKENPDFNVGCVGKPDGIVILDCDTPGLGRRIEQESGQKFPDTFIVRSAGKRCLHVYFKQTAYSREIGNRKVGGMFDLQSNNRYVVGPGSWLAESDRTYDIVADSPIADFPAWLGVWIEKNSQSAKQAGCKSEPVNDDFDIDDMLTFFGLEYKQMGNWYNCYVECPVAGHQHEQSKLPGFFFNGQDLGWNCWASTCPSNGMNAGKVIKFLNEQREEKGLDRYPHLIWPDHTMEIVEAGTEEAEMPEYEEVAPIPEDVEISVPNPTYVHKPIHAVAKKVSVALDVVNVTSELATPTSVEVIHRLCDMPPECMYGWLGAKTLELGVPIGWGYPAMLAMAAARVKTPHKNIRPTIYACLIGPVHSGKGQTMMRSRAAFVWPNSETIIDESPYSDRGLAKQLAPTAALALEGPSAWNKAEPRLYFLDEMNVVMKKMGVPGATLSSMLNTLWSMDRAGGADKKAKEKIFSRLNILGGIPVKDTQDFVQLFGATTCEGLYDRFVYGLAPKWKYSIPDITEEDRDTVAVTVPQFCYEMVHEWRDAEGAEGRERLAEIALRVIVITSAINHDAVVTPECVTAALEFIEWQEAIRERYKPGTSEPDKESRCSEAVRNLMMNWAENHAGEDGKAQWRFQKTFYKSGNWWRYGAGTSLRVIKSFIECGMIEQETKDEVDLNDRHKDVPTGRIRWVL